MLSDSIPRQAVYAALRDDLPFFGIACITFVAGILALVAARLKYRDRLFLWVGIFSVLYAIRLFLENDLVRDAFNVPGADVASWTLCITYVIPIPYALFARELFGRGWKGSITTWLWLEIAFAIAAIPAALLFHLDHATDLTNSALVIGGTALVLSHAVARRSVSDSLAASLTWPLLIFGIFVVLENRGVLRADQAVRSGGAGGIDLEPVGFFILLVGLIWTALRRAFATERKLIDVEQELATARRIQASIIPETPSGLASLHIATRYQPMTSVAGDFYDFLIHGDSHLTILVADVSGHGVPAALLASMLKVCFAAQRGQANNPAAILTGLNLMLRGSLGGQYITAACAAIDTEAGIITYSGAGHPPSLLLRREARKVVELAENGLFIGPFPNANYSNGTVSFR
ncbi:MAG TPA: SpoIIE family protein phosphatase [Bryobacteraceae bacterium]